jgi:hypothetical protein
LTHNIIMRAPRAEQIYSLNTTVFEDVAALLLGKPANTFSAF